MAVSYTHLDVYKRQVLGNHDPDSSHKEVKEYFEEAVIKNPSIVSANETVKKGALCVENIHADYELSLIHI